MIDFGAVVLTQCMAVFGETPSNRPIYQRASGGAAFPIDGVFDDAYDAVVIQAGGEPGVATQNPVLGIRIAQFAGVPPAQGDTVTVPRVGKTYMVVDVQADGQGGGKLVLTEAAS